ncbi:hypothetical protein UG55_101961 [Frankia sp. EI5c]|nr:hypothetical protein UG55_101961 [Frankia sp. EI5c]
MLKNDYHLTFGRSRVGDSPRPDITRTSPGRILYGRFENGHHGTSPPPGPHGARATPPDATAAGGPRSRRRGGRRRRRVWARRGRRPPAAAGRDEPDKYPFGTLRVNTFLKRGNPILAVLPSAGDIPPEVAAADGAERVVRPKKGPPEEGPARRKAARSRPAKKLGGKEGAARGRRCERGRARRRPAGADQRRPRPRPRLRAADRPGGRYTPSCTCRRAAGRRSVTQAVSGGSRRPAARPGTPLRGPSRAPGAYRAPAR